MATHRYWRVNVTTCQGSDLIEIAELRFLDATGTVIPATGGGLFESSEYNSTFTGSKAFDNDPSTMWASASNPSVGSPQWLQYVWAVGSPVDVRGISMMSAPTGFALTAAPAAGDVSYSDDGTTWTVAFPWTVGPYTANGQTKTFQSSSNTAAVQGSEGRMFGLFSSTTTAERVSEGRVFGVYNVPSVGEQASRSAVFSVIKQDASPIQVTEARTFAVVRGRLENHRVRAFPFRLDGHDYYGIRLGEDSTLVYDLTTQQWAKWASESLTNAWRPSTGMNWTGMGKVFFDNGATSDVILGDDTFGLLWGLKPESGIDQHPDPLRSDLPYPRRVVGGITMRMRETQKVGAAYLIGSMATPQLTGGSITLRTSDDAGKNWQDHGTLTVDPGNYDQEFVWRSLGLVKAPGRIFEITDNGATVRLDSLDIR